MTYTPLEALKGTLAKNPDDFLTFLRVLWDEGNGTVGDENDNGVFPEWNPQKIFDILA